jgi:hypothetical protein
MVSGRFVDECGHAAVSAFNEFLIHTPASVYAL